MTLQRTASLGGIILCGGHSRRMGSPKPWLPFGNELLLQRMVRIMSESLSPIVVVAAKGQSLPSLLSHAQVTHDAVEDNGPLQGLEAGLSAMNAHAEAAFVSACDTPFLNTKFIWRLMENLGECDICAPMSTQHLHSLSAIYRVRLVGLVRELLKSGEKRLWALHDHCQTRKMDHSLFRDIDPELRSLENMNTPELYEAALQVLASGSPSTDS
jgi:molybdopterin-guanine dinucleotide biosynthesis protein A